VIKRFTIESTRIYGVLNDQLADCGSVAGDQFSIADIAWYPWIEYHEWQGQALTRFPHVTSLKHLREFRRYKGGLKGAELIRRFATSGMR
jgi:glutathione S-transferase